MRRPTTLSRVFLVIILASTIIGSSMMIQFLPSAFAAGTINGTVFHDYDADGARDSGEPGIQGITVTAYDAAGATQGTTTSTADGTYTLNATGTGPYRVEFMDWPGYLQPGAYGSQNGTSVQFVPDGNSSNVNFALTNPANYCHDNPSLATACYVNGDPTGGGTAGSLDWLVESPYNPSGTSGENTYLADGADVGATWGLAYQRSTNLLFSAAMMKRHSGLGSLGTGGIYVVDRSNPTTVITPFVDLDNDLSIDTGTDPRLPGDLSPASTSSTHDPRTFDSVGKVALGNIDISEDETTLWVMNLHDRTLYEIFVDNPARTPTLTDVTAHAIPSPTCNLGEWRPWAVTVHNGLVYIGGVCSGENGGTSADLRAHIMSHDPTGADGAFTNVYDFPLNYPRGDISRPGSSPAASAAWLPWIDQWTDIGPPMPTPGNGPYGQTMYPQPMLTDIEFDTDGSMIIGLVDRAGHQLGNSNYSTDTNDTTEYEGAVGGDILRVCNNNGTYVLENNASCAGGNSTSGTNNQGPGGGEYYWQDMFRATTDINGGGHQEITLGGLALWPGSGEVASSVFDPTENVRSGGIVWFANSDGTRTQGYEIFGTDAGTGPSTFGKAAGLGELQLLCEPAPIEIGNLVWRDDNGNGVQDPGEPGIAGVTVRLYTDSGTLIAGATAVTDADGHYYFSSDPAGTSTGDSIYNLPLQPNTDYVVRVNRATDYDPTGPLAGMVLTTPDSDATTNGDARDNDAAQQSATSMRVDLTTGDHGHNNHTYDIGFIPTMSVGSYVWADIDNDGTQDPSENGIPGATVALLVDDGTGTFIPATDVNGDPVTNQTTVADGLYFFDNLPVGNYRVQVTPPAGYLPSTTQTTADNDDTAEDSNIATEPTPGTYQSGTFTLTPDGEPTESGAFAGDDQDNTTAEDHGNMTVDFGFVPALSLGNRIWHDLDNNGTLDGSESGIGGVAVTLYANDGTTVISTTTTTADGHYLFQDLAPGDYIVALDATNFTSG
ncbi:MAG: SdrD B-like domain-containing protein, partial [Chloroflexota bacterium]